MPKEYLTLRAIAEELAIDRHVPAKWIRKGLLVAVDVSEGGGLKARWRVERQELERFLRERRARPPAPRRRRRRRRQVTQYY